MEDKILLTTNDILEKEFKIDARGYRPQEVDKFLDVVINDYTEYDKLISRYENELKEALNENAQSAKPKPEQIIIDKIVPGRLEKAFKEICLLSQMFIMDANVKISDYLNNNKATVVSFIKFKVGDGIEKQETDFAAEVAAQAAAFQK